jgi:hypothetical protein
VSTVNLDEVLTGRDGKPIKDGEKNYTVRAALFQAIDTPAEGDQTMAANVRLDLYRLGDKIAMASENTVEFTADEATLIIGRLDKLAFIPLVYGQLVKIIDPAKLK